ncbi:O-antigen ligase family protein [Patescibacteria group bacterium]|nr:O-antigen ligase family protein [Patescibacteria group bacterium]
MLAKLCSKKTLFWGMAFFLLCIVGAITAYTTSFSVLIVLGLVFAGWVCIKTLNDPTFGIVLIAFLLPFERIGSFELGGITVRPSQLVGLLVLVSWILLRLTRKQKTDVKNPTIPFLALFLGISLISLISAVNLGRGLTVFLFEFFVIILSIIIPTLITDKKALKRVITALLISCALVSFFGMYQFLGDMAGVPSELTGLREHYTKAVFGFPRVQSTALEPLYFGNYLLLPIALLIAFFVRRKDLVSKKMRGVLSSPIFVIVVLTIACINVLLTVSRGAYIGLAVVLLLSFIVFFRYFISPKKIIPIVVVALIAGFALVQFIGINERDGLETFVEHTTNVSSGAGIEERFTTYYDALDMANRHPLIGVGVGNFGPSIAQNPYQTPDDGWLIVNNIYLEIMAERGIFALGVFACLIILLIVRSIKALKEEGDLFTKTVLLGFLIAFIAILVQYLTFSILYIMHVWFVIGMLVALQNMLLADKK